MFESAILFKAGESYSSMNEVVLSIQKYFKMLENIINYILIRIADGTVRSYGESWVNGLGTETQLRKGQLRYAYTGLYSVGAVILSTTILLCAKGYIRS